VLGLNLLTGRDLELLEGELKLGVLDGYFFLLKVLCIVTPSPSGLSLPRIVKIDHIEIYQFSEFITAYDNTMLIIYCPDFLSEKSYRQSPGELYSTMDIHMKNDLVFKTKHVAF
jgi:hypothetical protein